MPSFHFNPDRTDSCTRNGTRHNSTRPEINALLCTHSPRNTGGHSISRHSSDDLAWTAPQADLLMQDHSQLSVQTILLRFDSLFFHSLLFPKEEKSPQRITARPFPEKTAPTARPETGTRNRMDWQLPDMHSQSTAEDTCHRNDARNSPTTSTLRVTNPSPHTARSLLFRALLCAFK